MTGTTGWQKSAPTWARTEPNEPPRQLPTTPTAIRRTRFRAGARLASTQAQRPHVGARTTRSPTRFRAGALLPSTHHNARDDEVAPVSGGAPHRGSFSLVRFRSARGSDELSR